MNVCGKEIKVQGRLVRIAQLAAEGFEFVDDPEAVVKELHDTGSRVDMLTFTQRLPAAVPEYPYPMEWDNVAAMPVTTFEHWWAKQIDSKTRNMIRRSEKKGVVLKELPFNEMLVRGICEIYNECPVRQGRPFPHYGKDLEAVRKMSATFLETSGFIGAFLDDQMIGFVKFTWDRRKSQAALMHILAKVEHRDKAPMNALVAQAVKSCENRRIPYLVYSKFSFGSKGQDGLSDFKENNGFRRIAVPKYYLPLTGIGRWAYRLRLHHGFRDRIPEPLAARLRQLRSDWYKRRFTELTEAR